MSERKRTSARRIVGAAGIALAAALAGAMGGCIGPSPVVSLQGVQQRGPGAQYAVGAPVEVEFDMLVENPSKSDYPLVTIRYTVHDGNAQVFRGRRSAEATAPGKGSMRVRLPAVVPAAGAYGADLSALTISGEMTSLAPGALAEALFDADVRRPTVQFNASVSAMAAAPAPAPASEQPPEKDPGAQPDPPPAPAEDPAGG
jgi:hypothetical protein